MRSISSTDPRITKPHPSPEAIARLQRLYSDRFGVRIDSAQAQAILTGLMRILYATHLRDLAHACPDEPITDPHDEYLITPNVS